MSVSAAVMERNGERYWVVTEGTDGDAARVVLAMELRDKGHSLRDIGRIVGRSHTWVQTRLRGNGYQRSGNPLRRAKRKGMRSW